VEGMGWRRRRWLSGWIIVVTMIGRHVLGSQDASNGTPDASPRAAVARRRWHLPMKNDVGHIIQFGSPVRCRGSQLPRDVRCGNT
jgi:hypothetical protein